MSLKALQEYTFTSRYARYLKNKNRRETWSEAVNRCKDMMLEKYKDIPEVHPDIEWAYEMMRKKRVLGSQRAMQFGGKPVLDKNMRMYNCVSSYCDRVKFFQECMWLLLAGCGTGFSVQKHHVDKLPKLLKEKQGYKKFVIEDTIEGWADSVGVLVSSYFKQTEVFHEYSGYKITFDYSKIRVAGSPLSYGGKAPGPEPLKIALNKIKDLLDKTIENGQSKLKPIQAYDIVMYSADAVISGGVRRSATIALFSEDDDEMMKAKTGNWFHENPQRGRSNNSVVLLKNELTKEKLSKIIESVKEYGEPGFILSNNYEHLVNPCVSGDTIISVVGQGYVQIKDVVDKEIEVWNGFEWTKVTPRITGYNQELFEVKLDNGLSLKCTANHRWYIDCPQEQYLNNPTGDEFYIKETKNLKIGDGLYYFDRPMQPTIKSIKSIGIEDKVYCFKDIKRGMGYFNGIITGQCVEISFYAYNENGESGWQACNLSTINDAKIKTKEDFFEAAKAAAIIGTLQAGFTDTGYLGDISKQIIEREALLGVSMTGIMDSPDICLNPEIQKQATDIVRKTNERIAKLLNIRQAARLTCIKPEGSASCVLGTSSGIHPHHATKYIRRIQSNKQENVYQFFKKINPRACQDSVWSTNDTDGVISFCVEVPPGSKTKNQLGAIDLLKYVKSTQDNWVVPGTNKELCTQDWLVHNVSNTINVKPEEWNDVVDYIYDNKESFCGISLLPITGDKDYPQAPFTTIYTPNEMVHHYKDGIMFVSGLIEVALKLWEDNLWKACDCALGIGEKVKGTAKKDWVSRCEKFANKYFEGSLRKLTYAMKDVYNYKLWTELNLEYKDVDFSQLIEIEDETKVSQDLACSGGTCELK